MKIVIDISEEDYNECKNRFNMIFQEGYFNFNLNTALVILVANGTPLPKGHGRLIDADELLKAIDTWDKFGVDDTNSLFRLDNLSLPHYVPYIHYDDVVKSVSGAETIIPADKREEE